MDLFCFQYHKLPEESLAAMELNRDPTGMPFPVELCFTANDVEIFPNNTYIVHSGVLHSEFVTKVCHFYVWV